MRLTWDLAKRKRTLVERGLDFPHGMGRQEVRIAYVINQTDLAAALTCLEHALRQYPGRSESLPAVTEEIVATLTT